MLDLFPLPDVSTLAPLLGPAVVWGWVWMSALARLLGLLVLGPIFSQQGVSVWLRIGLAGCLATVVTPVLIASGGGSLPVDAGAAIAHLGGEFVLGALLGFGVLFVFAGLRLAGELIDQQAGSAVQEVFDPQGSGTTTAAGGLLTIVGTLALLCVAPGDGYLRIVGTLLDSFRIVPAEVAFSGAGVVRLLSDLGQTSLSLGLQVAAPVLAAGAIVSWGVGQLSSSSGSPLATTLLGLPVRVVTSLGILTLCLSGVTDAVLISVGGVLDRFPQLLSGG